MKLIPQKKFFRFISLLFVTTLMLLPSLYCGVAIPARAEASPEVPEASTDFYYNDQANLLSEETRSLILTKNAALAPHSIQLVVLTMDTLPVTGYTQRVEYLRSVMQSWQVGGAEGRGLLLALSVSDGDYIAVAAQLEPDFSAGSYDAGVSKFITEAASQAETFAVSSGSQPVSAKPAPKKDDGVPVLLWVALGAGAVAVLCIAVFLLSGRQSRRYSPRRGVHRHAPLVTPPRTNVLRHESHTPIIVKSARRGDGPSRIRKL